MLTSLDFAPNAVEGIFDCTKNSLTKLNCPTQYVASHFACQDNNLIITQEIIEEFQTQIGGRFYFDKTEIKELLELQSKSAAIINYLVEGAQLSVIQEKFKFHKVTQNFNTNNISSNEKNKIHKI